MFLADPQALEARLDKLVGAYECAIANCKLPAAHCEEHHEVCVCVRVFYELQSGIVCTVTFLGHTVCRRAGCSLWASFLLVGGKLLSASAGVVSSV